MKPYEKPFFQSSVYALAASLGLGVASLASFNPSASQTTSQTLLLADDISAVWMGTPIQPTEIEAEDALISASRGPPASTLGAPPIFHARNPSQSTQGDLTAVRVFQYDDAQEGEQQVDGPLFPAVNIVNGTPETTTSLDFFNVVTGRVNHEGQLYSRAPFPRTSPLFKTATLRSEVAKTPRLSVDIMPVLSLKPESTAVLLSALVSRFNQSVENLPASNRIKNLRPFLTTLRDDFARRAHGIRLTFGHREVTPVLSMAVGSFLHLALQECENDVKDVAARALRDERATTRLEHDALLMNLTVPGADYSTKAARVEIEAMTKQRFQDLHAALQDSRLDFFCQAPTREKAEKVSEGFAAGFAHSGQSASKTPTFTAVDWAKLESHMRIRSPHVKEPFGLVWLGKSHGLAMALPSGCSPWRRTMHVGDEMLLSISPDHFRSPEDFSRLTPQQLKDQMAARLFVPESEGRQEVRLIVDRTFLRSAGFLPRVPESIKLAAQKIGEIGHDRLENEYMCGLGRQITAGKVVILEPRHSPAAPEGFRVQSLEKFRRTAPRREVPFSRTGDSGEVGEDPKVEEIEEPDFEYC